jgi:hypothetical protein
VTCNESHVHKAHKPQTCSNQVRSLKRGKSHPGTATAQTQEGSDLAMCCYIMSRRGRRWQHLYRLCQITRVHATSWHQLTGPCGRAAISGSHVCCVGWAHTQDSPAQGAPDEEHTRRHHPQQLSLLKPAPPKGRVDNQCGTAQVCKQGICPLMQTPHIGYAWGQPTGVCVLYTRQTLRLTGMKHAVET